MKLITLYLPETYITALDQLVDEHFYPNRAEAIRVAIRDLISSEVWRRQPPIIYPVSKQKPPEKLSEIEKTIQFQTYKPDIYETLANPKCPHCGKPLRRSKNVWRGRYSWYCEDDGRVLPACTVCDKNHHSELTKVKMGA